MFPHVSTCHLAYYLPRRLAEACPQDVPWGHGYGFQTGRGHAPVQGEQREEASLHVFMASLSPRRDMMLATLPGLAPVIAGRRYFYEA